MVDKPYDPKAVVAAFTKQRGGRLTNQKQAPDAYDIRPAPATLCFPLMAFVMNAPELPDDFHNVTRSSDGLKTYQRPDGAVFIGLFELPNDPNSTIVVFGDPLMELSDAKLASIMFRRRLMRHIEDGRVPEQTQQAQQQVQDGFAGKPSKLEH